MLITIPRVKQAFVRTVSFVNAYRRLLFIIVFILPVIAYLFAWILCTTEALFPRPLRLAKEVLIVVAHPDDECAPLVSQALTLQHYSSHLASCGRCGVVRGKAICLCYQPVETLIMREVMIGNNYGLGKTRKVELEGACKALGITRKDRCLSVDYDELQDHPKEWWDSDFIATVVEKVVKKWRVDAIITFDDYGVSGHINHRAVSVGVRHYVLSTRSDLPAYQLSSVFLLRKYTALLDLPLVLFFSIPRMLVTMFTGDAYGSWGLMVANPGMYFTARSAFQNHASQVVWDRYLHPK